MVTRALVVVLVDAAVGVFVDAAISVIVGVPAVPELGRFSVHVGSFLPTTKRGGAECEGSEKQNSLESC
jgi:hypothetical protein